MPTHETSVPTVQLQCFVKTTVNELTAGGDGGRPGRNGAGGPLNVVRSLPIPKTHGRSRKDLTGREIQVLAAIIQGKSNRSIGRDLRISEHTVKAHIRSIFAKLRVASRTEAAMAGLRLGMVSLA
ncbi:response regulator transcription factor [Streptomyces pinistramenti]|uniref:response regulator transcription factor n=1 Tax=Streptomyces pinistramenti TaxID=2884812 RepID=UPI001D091F45|nr:LuxR C-terminal-related transcriptional regulator [Streptomyces pinistramenti]MCB5908050.1 LuxR C-terminal-related transcriptional regulator [Streptomyces pinistramenti]